MPQNCSTVCHCSLFVGLLACFSPLVDDVSQRVKQANPRRLLSFRADPREMGGVHKDACAHAHRRVPVLGGRQVSATRRSPDDAVQREVGSASVCRAQFRRSGTIATNSLCAYQYVYSEEAREIKDRFVVHATK